MTRTWTRVCQTKTRILVLTWSYNHEATIMNTHGSIKNPRWFFAAPNLWFRRTLQGSFKEPHVRVIKMVLLKEPSKRVLCSTFWGCQYRDSPKNPKRCHLAPFLLRVYRTPSILDIQVKHHRDLGMGRMVLSINPYSGLVLLDVHKQGDEGAGKGQFTPDATRIIHTIKINTWYGIN